MMAASASQFKEPGLKKNVGVENKLASKIKKRKRDYDYIKYGFSSQKLKIEQWAVCSMDVLLF